MAGYIVASSDTRAAIGEDFIDFIGKLADEGKITAPRAILSTHDVTSDNPFGWIADLANIGHAFEAAGYEGTTDETRGMSERLERIQQTGPAARPIRDHDSIGGIILHYEVDNPLFIPSEMTGIPAYELNLNLHPTSMERFYLLHEIVHIGQDDATNTIQHTIAEYEGDQLAIPLYYEAYQANLVADLEAPYAFRALRAIDTIYATDGNYTLNGITTFPGETPVITGTPSEAIIDVWAARDALELELGKTLVSETDAIRLKALQNTQYTYVGDTAPEFALSDDMNIRINEALANEDSEEIARILDEIELPPEYQAAYEEELQIQLEYEQEHQGSLAMKDNPHLLYETARMMLERGDLDGNVAGKALLTNFVDGVQRYAPDHYQVAMEDRPSGPPPIVEQLARDYAPTLEVSVTGATDTLGVEAVPPVAPATANVGGWANK